MPYKAVCTKCQSEYHVARMGAIVIEMASFGVYKVWSADLLECRGCGHQIVSGFANLPIRADHYAPDFKEWLDDLKIHCTEEDIPIFYDYERPQIPSNVLDRTGEAGNDLYGDN